MTFVLVDYKGGSAFKDCVHLPHVTGMVTDLDAHLTQRALASLSAELTRRERVLAAAGAKDIEEYTERGGRQPRRPPLPRLVIVIDEFASLVRDLPDFVTGLVGIAQRGRSLGIHLILATQRPSGRGVGRHPGQHQPADRAAGHRRRRERRRDRRAGRRADLPGHPGPRLRAARPRLAGAVPGRADRRPPVTGGSGRPAAGAALRLGQPGPPGTTPSKTRGSGGQAGRRRDH